ncbi:MAG: 50S ribosomal protein L15 [Patescibacteria group bacterium]
MQTHQIRPLHKTRKRKIVGRGGKKGTYSGKGGKGQTARAGRKLAPIIREVIKRYPKLRGYRSFELPNNLAVVNLDVIEKKFNEGETVSPKSLIEKGIVRPVYGKNPSIKILGNGKITKKINFENCRFSKSAKEAVEKAGGSVK